MCYEVGSSIRYRFCFICYVSLSKKSGDGNVHPLLQYFLFFVCFCEVKITQGKEKLGTVFLNPNIILHFLYLLLELCVIFIKRGRSYLVMCTIQLNQNNVFCQILPQSHKLFQITYKLCHPSTTSQNLTKQIIIIKNIILIQRCATNYYFIPSSQTGLFANDIKQFVEWRLL